MTNGLYSIDYHTQELEAVTILCMTTNATLSSVLNATVAFYQSFQRSLFANNKRFLDIFLI